jgi:hypothetical protein
MGQPSNILFPKEQFFLKNTRWPILFTSCANEDSKTQKKLLCLPTLFTSHANKTKQNKINKKTLLKNK